MLFSKNLHLLFLCLFGLISGLFWSCGGVEESPKTPEKGLVERPVLKDGTVELGGVKVDFMFPGRSIQGSLLVLPGWNFSRTDVCENSSLCKVALDSGFVLILPEMGKSIYHSQIFPETREDWREYPGLKWVTDTLIPRVQEDYSLLLPGENNFVYGISTGARGVAQLATHTKNIFRCGIALSGDYDQRDLKSDNLMTGYYGPYEKFRDRWEGEDNPVMNVKKVDFPVFMCHGKNDKVVPYSQSQKFFDALHGAGKISGLSPVDTAGHNYGFWDSQTGFAMKMIFLHKKSDEPGPFNTSQQGKQ
jgi:hypothetical protein